MALNNKQKIIKALSLDTTHPIKRNHYCSEDSHKKGFCLACYLLYLSFKKSKIIFLKSQGFEFVGVNLRQPIPITHKEKNKLEGNFSENCDTDFQFKSLEEFRQAVNSLFNNWKQVNNRKSNMKFFTERLPETYRLIDYVDYESNHIKSLLPMEFLFNRVNKDPIEEFFEDDGSFEKEESLDSFTVKSLRQGISQSKRLSIFERDRYKCFYCGWQNALEGENDRILTIDHIIPLNFGGTNKISNLVTCCLNCNSEKNDKIPIEILGNWVWKAENKT